MRESYGGQQGDEWLKVRVGRITASRIGDVCSYLTRKSGDKVPGQPTATRDAYLLELIAARLTGQHKDHYKSEAMDRGSALEEDARRCYAAMVDEEVYPVGFVLHPLYDFTGASADSVVGDDGVLEIKCLLPWNHLSYVLEGKIPEEHIPQIGWEMACAGRKWCDFVLYCPDIHGEGNERLRFFHRRVTIDDLRWKTWDKTVLVGQAVLDYFTAEVLKMEAEIQAFFKKDGCTPVAPFLVRLKDDSEPPAAPESDYDASKPFEEQDYSFLGDDRNRA
jgi:exodeoxyribonuclease (lambda-induced)